MPDDTPKTFFSYAREDSAFVLRLAQDLRGAGAAVWLDQLDIGPGHHWDKEVEDALHQCPRLVIVLSPDSANSPNVMDEVSYALEERKQVIPLLYRECTIPYRLRRMQYIDFREYARGLRELLKSLDASRPSPEPFPAVSPPAVASGPAGATGGLASGAEVPPAREVKPRRKKKRWVIAVLTLLALGLLWRAAAAGFQRAGYASSKRKDLDGAIGYFNVALTLNPYSASAYIGRGLVYNSKQDYDRAIQDCSRALVLDPKDYYGYTCRGSAYSMKRDFERAINDLTQALALGGNSDIVYLNRGELFALKGDYDRAILDFSLALIGQRSALAYSQRGLAYEHRGRLNEALQDIEQAVQLDPNDVTYRTNRDRIAAKLHHH